MDPRLLGSLHMIDDKLGLIARHLESIASSLERVTMLAQNVTDEEIVTVAGVDGPPDPDPLRPFDEAAYRENTLETDEGSKPDDAA